MPELINPLFAAGQFLVGETERLWNANAFDELFAGSVQQMEQRWAGTAVLDNAGSWHVVRCSGHVQGEGASRRVKLFEGGSFGRGFFRDAAWFKASAVVLYLGALRVPDGDGARAVSAVGGAEIVVVVGSPEGAPADGR